MERLSRRLYGSRFRSRNDSLEPRAEVGVRTMLGVRHDLDFLHDEKRDLLTQPTIPRKV